MPTLAWACFFGNYNRVGDMATQRLAMRKLILQRYVAESLREVDHE